MESRKRSKCFEGSGLCRCEPVFNVSRETNDLVSDPSQRRKRRFNVAGT